MIGQPNKTLFKYKLQRKLRHSISDAERQLQIKKKQNHLSTGVTSSYNTNAENAELRDYK